MTNIIVASRNFENSPKITILNKFILFSSTKNRENNRRNGALDGGVKEYPGFALLTALGIIHRYGEGSLRKWRDDVLFRRIVMGCDCRPRGF